MADVSCSGCGEPWGLAEPDPDPCLYCDGLGAVGASSPLRPCPHCRGRGTEYPTVAARIARTGRCPACPPPPSVLTPYIRT